MKRKTTILAVCTGLIVVVALSVAVLALTKSKNAQATAFPVGSSLAIARAHSKGTLPACLSKNPAADAAVRKDDSLLGKESAFDEQATRGIDNVPAGTNVDVSVHSYDGKTATGTAVYPTQYGSYNVTIAHTSHAKSYQWNMTSLIACRKG